MSDEVADEHLMTMSVSGSGDSADVDDSYVSETHERPPEYQYKTVEYKENRDLEEFIEKHATDGWRFIQLVDDPNSLFDAAVFERLERRGSVKITAERDEDAREGILWRLFG